MLLAAALAALLHGRPSFMKHLPRLVLQVRIRQDRAERHRTQLEQQPKFLPAGQVRNVNRRINSANPHHHAALAQGHLPFHMDMRRNDNTEQPVPRTLYYLSE